MKKTKILALTLLMAMNASAQSIQEADGYFKEFQTASLNHKRNAETYDMLYKSYQGYMHVMQNEEKGSTNYKTAKEMLLRIFNHLGEASYYFTEQDDEKNVLKYARPFVDIALMEDFADKNLFATPEFPQFPFLLATSAYMAKQYQESIPYYKAYLETGDLSYDEDAFAQLISAFYHIKLYDEAVSVAMNATRKYPTNWTIINLAIHACELGKLDHDLQHFLDLGHELKPRDLYLVEMQAGLYERQHKYAEAAESYLLLNELKPNLATISSHLGIDYYNAGTLLFDDAEQLPIQEDAQKARMQAMGMFHEAVPYLNDVLSNYPYAVNIMRALAMCENMLGDSLALKDANILLADQKIKPVKSGDKPMLENNYNPEVKVLSTYNAQTDNSSTVDVDIPEAMKANSNKDTYAIIFGNEEYKHISRVNYAHNDAKSFAEYCRKLMGIPSKNITLALDATKTEMDQIIAKLQEQARMSPGKLSFIIYYAGHGLPDVVRGVSYLVPSDADGSDFQYCYSLNRLYDQLDKVDSKGVTVFLDACFSGGARNGGSVLSERYVFHGEQNAEVEGKTISFSAASNQQTALPYDEEHHGIFTYVLLKALKDSKGKVTYGQLAEILKEEVDQIAIDTKNKRQSPKVSTSDALENTWEEMTLLKK